MTAEKPTGAARPKQLLELQMAAHLAEYSALTTRCTYWIAIQYALWPVLGALLTFEASLWNTVNHSLLIWAAVATAQVLLLGWNTSLREIYQAVRYIEREVRPAVSALTADPRIWRYETYNEEHRGALTAWWEYATPASFVVVLAFVALVRRPLNRIDLVGLIANAGLLVCATIQTASNVRIRRDFSPPPPHRHLGRHQRKPGSQGNGSAQ